MTWEELHLFEVEPTSSKKVKWRDVPDGDVKAIFDLWRKVHGKKRAQLSPERWRKIAQAICSHGSVMASEAIHGCLLSDWHMGRNPQGKRYDDIGLILRNAEKIEYFADLFHTQSNAGGFLDNI